MGVEHFKKQRDVERLVVSVNGKRLALPACWTKEKWDALPRKKQLFIFRACTSFSFYLHRVFLPHISEAEGEECPERLPAHMALFAKQFQERVPEELLPFDHERENPIWRVCMVWPTGCFKSSLQLAAASWLIGLNPNISIVMATSTATLGERFVSFQEDNIRTNHVFRFVFGDLDPKKTRANRVWRNDAIEVERPLPRATATFQIVGYGGSFEGTRFDIAILDDIVDFMNSKTDDARANQWLWVTQVVERRLHPRRRMLLVVGTVHHRDDVYHRCATEAKEKGTWSFLGFKMIPQSAVDAGLWPPKKKNPQLPYSADNVIVPKNLPTLWPEFWSAEVLVAEYISNQTTFARTRQNEIDDPDMAVFTPNMLEFCLANGKIDPAGMKKPELPFWNYVDGIPHPDSPIGKMYAVAGIDIEYAVVVCDLAATEKKPGRDPDWTVVQAWGWCRNTRRRILLDMMRFRTGNPKIVKSKLCDFVRGYLPIIRKVAAEGNAVDKLFVGELDDYLRNELGTAVSVLTLRGEKTEKIEAFKDLISDAGVWIPYSDRSERTRKLAGVFRQELLDFPSGKHDDTLIAAVHHLTILKSGSVSREAGVTVLGYGATEDERQEADLGVDEAQREADHLQAERAKQMQARSARGVGEWGRARLSLNQFRAVG